MADNPKDCKIDASYMPVDKTAGVVISRGVHYEHKIHGSLEDVYPIWDIPQLKKYLVM